MQWNLIKSFQHDIIACNSLRELWETLNSLKAELDLNDLVYLADPAFGLDETNNQFWCRFQGDVRDQNLQKRKPCEAVHAIVSDLNALAFDDDTMVPFQLPNTVADAGANTEWNLKEQLVDVLGCDAALGYYLCPVYGARSNDGYFLFSVQAHNDIKASIIVNTLQSILQAAHVKFTKLKREGMIVKKITKRERQVLRCLVRGQTNNQIADTLSISPFTVNSYLRNLYLKLDCSEKTTAVLKAIAYNAV